MKSKKKNRAQKSYLPFYRWGGPFSLFLILCLLFSCSTSKEGVKRVYEEGVEVVLNRLEPYDVEGLPSTLTLERLFSIDTEQDAVAETGLVDTAYFDIDSEGYVYFLGPVSGENMVFKFSEKGEFLFSFGRIGQGPGEIQRGYSIQIVSDDSVVITNGGNNRLTIFYGDGTLKEEIATGSNVNAAALLPNGNVLLYKNILDPASDYLTNPLFLCSPELEELKELDTQMVPNPLQGERLKGTWHIFSWSVSAGAIFTGYQERGYEISVFDFDGQLVRKIKKDFRPVPVPQSHRDEFNDAFSSALFDDIRNKIYFPANMPPFCSFITDERGWLYVMTYEEGDSPGEYLFDIFTPEGVFVGRTVLPVLIDENGLYAKIKNDRLYTLLEKESGYKELVVFRLLWE